MRHIDKAIIHCSASTWGTEKDIDRWHRQRGWNGCGYHFVILNGQLTPKFHMKKLDGVVTPGRPLSQAGAHTRGQNKSSIGICLIGNKSFTFSQYLALNELLRELESIVGALDVYGHNDFTINKTCPNFNLNKVLDYDFC